MKRHVFCLIAALAAAAPGSRAVADTDAEQSEIAVIVHNSSTVERLNSAELEAIFTSTMRRWPGGSAIVAFHYAPGHPLRTAFDRAVLRMDPEAVGRFWVDQRIRGRPGPPRRVPNPRLMLRVIERLRGGIGYVPADMLDTNVVRVVARIRAGVVVAP